MVNAILYKDLWYLLEQMEYQWQQLYSSKAYKHVVPQNSTVPMPPYVSQPTWSLNWKPWHGQHAPEERSKENNSSIILKHFLIQPVFKNRDPS